MYRALLCSSSGGQIVIYSIWYRHTVGGRPVHRLNEDSSLNLCTGRPPTECNDTRCCILQFDLLMMSTIVLDTCRGI